MVSVKFLMVGETNSMVGYYLMAKDHSIQLGVWEVQGSTLETAPWRELEFLKFLNMGLKKMFEKPKIDTF